MTFEPGDLVLVPFPYADLKAAKRRPVLALTAPDRHGDFIGLAVTSVPQAAPQVAIDNAAMAAGMLPRPSWVRVDKVFTLDTSLVLRVLGKLGEAAVHQVLAGLCARIGFP